MYRHKNTKTDEKVKIKIERINEKDLRETKKRKKEVCVRSKFVLFGLVVKQLILPMRGIRSVFG